MSKPDFKVFCVRHVGETSEGKERTIWRRIGSAWWHRSSTGISVALDAYPVNGRLVLLTPSEETADEVTEEAERGELVPDDDLPF